MTDAADSGAAVDQAASDANKARVADFWDALYGRDWDRLPGFFATGAQYTDVFTPDADVARGAGQIVHRLKLGIEPLEAFAHHPKLMIAEGDVVMTEHAEEWTWHTGENVTIKFASVHELADGLITRWWDYPDLQKLIGAAPQWWIDHILGGWEGGPAPDADYISGT